MRLETQQVFDRVGDRFTHQARAQLKACTQALKRGVEVIPVWNKSNREHTLIGSEPGSTRHAADDAVRALHWEKQYFCDADHITFETVDRFLKTCDFYTIDVADSIGQLTTPVNVEAFVERHPELLRQVRLEGVKESFEITKEDLRSTAQKFLAAVMKAGEVYRKTENSKGADNFVSEISIDETDRAQSPTELLVILAAIAEEHIPIQTIAPKFSGRFNQGVDYAGDVAEFDSEMVLDVAAIGWAIRQYGLPDNLKLSIHSGGDKFSLYPCIHLKTAGTTWLEELIGLAEAGGDGLKLAKDIYVEAFRRQDELCAPYATVVDIRRTELPSPEEVGDWSSEQYTSALRHVPASAAYNRSFRQLLPVSLKIAAKMGDRYLDLLRQNEAVIAKNVTENLYERHVVPVFLGGQT